MARINGIQRVNSIRPSSFLLNLESELQKELEVVLNQEEELWALKSHINWMIQRDRNTSFYHISTLVRRKRNQILAIKDLVGEWLHEEADIKDFIRKGFDGIYIKFSIALGFPQIVLSGRLGFPMKIRLVLVGKPRQKRLNWLFGLSKRSKLRAQMDCMQGSFKDFG